MNKPDLLPTTTIFSAQQAMEGNGYYNDHSQLQQSSIPYALPFLIRAAESVQLPDNPGVVVIADYGSSQGKNSLEPMKAAITTMRSRMIEHLPIAVFHNDQPANDFSSLFQVMESSPESYRHEISNVFSYATGRSFYERLFPDNQVSLGWSAWSVQWLSAIPAVIPDHFWYARASEEVTDAFRRQAKQDWDQFLWHRSRELHQGGYLVVHAAWADDQGLSGWEIPFDIANTVLQKMVEQDLLAQHEYGRMTLPVKVRTLSEYQETFHSGLMRNTLGLEDYSLMEFADPLWSQYESTQNAVAFAEAYAGLLLAVLSPSLFGMLDESRSLVERTQLKMAFYEQLRFTIQMNPEIGRGRKQALTLLIKKTN